MTIVENVDKIKNNDILNNKFKVVIHSAAQTEILKLEVSQQELLISEYSKIENNGIEFVKVRALHSKIFEIKSKEIRSLFKYQEGRIIIIGVVFVKQSQKTPNEKIRLAIKRLKDN